MHIDEDIKIIAAAFDRRSQETKKLQQQGGFYVNWETFEEKESNTVATTASSQIKKASQSSTKKQVAVDTHAVQEAVWSLSLMNENAKFQRKYAEWQQKQALHLDEDKQAKPHLLIPLAPNVAFVRSTPKAIRATANLTRSATLAEALVRIFFSPSFAEEWNSLGSLATKGATNALVQNSKPNSSLLIDIVGVDHVECSSTEKIKRTFSPLVKWLASNNNMKYTTVHFRLVGRELMVPSQLKNKVINLLEPEGTSVALRRASATCHSALYHEFLEASKDAPSSPRSQSDNSSTTPDLVVAFNAGIWGYEEWETTIQYLAQSCSKESQRPCLNDAVPFVVTAYTLSECQEDYNTIEKATTLGEDGRGSIDIPAYRARVLWEPQENPYGSKVIRETRSSAAEYRENACWQAWLLGD
jgi:hypothetical protein